jgi:hypothetical protein
MSGPCADRISPIVRKSFPGEPKMRLRHWQLLGPLRDTIPKLLQVANLLGLRQRFEARRLSDGSTSRWPLGFARP